MRFATLLTLFALALLSALLSRASAGLVINEFLASNRSTLADEDGDFEDWIELHNPTGHAANLSGWGLSDNPAIPFKWTFAADTVIAPGSYLLVWASGKDRPGGGMPVTTPDELGGLVVWLRADTAPYAAGQAVDRWSDSSGFGNDATQALPSQRPTFVANAVNGLPAVGFERSNSQQFFLPTSGFSGMRDFSNFTFLAVARWAGGTTSGLFGGFRGSNNTNSGSAVFEIPASGGSLRLRLPNTIDATATAAVTQNQWHILGAAMDGPAALARIFRDGRTVATASGTPGTTLLENYERFPIGSSHDDARTFGGQMAEVVVFNRSLPPEERAGLERHFIAKYNLPIPGSGAPSFPHTNFSISAAGETLSLTRPDGSTADQIGPVALAADIPYGRTLENPALWSMLETPTPGASNNSLVFIEPPAPVGFSHPSGIHHSNFQLSLNHPDPETTIIYTLDGSEPDINNLAGTGYQFRSYYNNGPLLPQSFTSLSYSSPISVRDRSSAPNKISLIPSTSDSNPSYLPASPVKKATVVRARAYRDGKAGPTAAATYFVSTTGAFNYHVPLVSLAFDDDAFFDYHKGIYVAGVDHVTTSGGRICNWGNFNRRGPGAERPGHFQFFENGALAVDQGVGFRIHGNCSRRNAFKSLRVHASDTYDPRDEFDHRFFDTPVPDSVLPENNLHKRLILRTPSINEVSFSRLYQPVYGGVGGRLRPVVTFFNGEYWGVSYLRDRLDQRYLARQYDLDAGNIALINIAYGHEVGSSALRVFNLDAGIPSDMNDFSAMRGFITGNNMANPARFAEAEALLDMRSFIDHLILKIFAGDDHYAPEYIFWRAREPEDDAFGDGRWRVMVKDFDSSLFTANYVTGLATGTHPRSFGFEVFRSLLANTSFRNAFINRFADLLNAHFLPGRFQEVIHHAYDEALPIWGEMSARWNNVALSNPSRPFTIAGRDSLINWSNQHPPRQRLHIRQQFGISSDVNLTVDVSDPGQGRVRVNTIDISGETPGITARPYPWTGVYFHNVPVTLVAIPAANHRFSGWMLNGSPSISSTNPTLVVTPTTATRVRAVFEELTPLHEWTFERANTYLQPSHSLGGAALGIAPGATTEVLQSAAGQGFASSHLRINNPLGATLDLAIPTTNFEKTSLSFLTRRSGEGAGLQTFYYTLDGTTWTAFETYPVDDANPLAKTFDFTDVSGVSNNPQFAVRITFAQGDGGLAGNNRFDDLLMTGIPLPGVNLPPFPTDKLPGRIDLVEGAPAVTLDPRPWFADAEGDSLVFAALTSRPAHATATVSGGQLVLGGVKRGESLVTLTAEDGRNPPVATTIRILVHPAAHPLASGAIRFTAWDANTPEQIYPPHMLFLQGVGNDSSVETLLDHAYHIPHDDYAEADLATLGYPYNNTARTRIDGLGRDGIAFINSGRGRDLGGALLALDTTGLTGARVAFTAGTVQPHTRIHAIRLQYRTGTSGPWTDLTDAGGQAVEYVRNDNAGHSTVLGPVDLPPLALGQPYIQLLWRYHHLDGTSGPRAQLRLDDVVVTPESATPPATLVFDSQPSATQSGMPLGPVVVRLLDGAGLTATAFNGPVTLSLSGIGSLGGTLAANAVRGVATFDDLVLTGSGSFQLVANAAGIDPESGSAIRSLALSATVIPRFIQGGVDGAGSNNERVPFAWRARIDGLEPHATYRFANRMVLASDSPTGNGAGNMIFITGATGDWLRSTLTPSFKPGDFGAAHFSLTAGADGSFTGWFITEPTGNVRFTPGNMVFPRLLLNDGDGGMQASHILTAPEGAGVIRFGSAAGEGTAIVGKASMAARHIALLFPDAAGFARPLAATPVEITGAGVDERYAPFYRDIIATQQSHWGTILPNNLAGGLQRIEIRAATGDGPPLATRIDPDGFAGTIDPSGGLTPMIISGTEDPGTYDQWRNLFFSDPAELADDTISGPQASAAGDGLANLLRYAHGVGPYDPFQALLPKVDSAVGGGLVLRLHLAKDKPDLAWLVRASPDLTDWTGVLFDSRVDPAPPPDAEGWSEITVPAGRSRLFLRLEVLLVAP